jgi:rod shape-determining protein MreB
MSHIRRKYKLMIGERTAEEIKIKIGSAFPEETEKTMEIGGNDLLKGSPKLQIIKSKEINRALKGTISSIINATKSIIEMTPPELSFDIMNNGITLTGGGALLNGFDELLKKETGLPVSIADNPLDCVAIGVGRALDKEGSLKLANALTLLKKYKRKMA